MKRTIQSVFAKCKYLTWNGIYLFICIMPVFTDFLKVETYVIFSCTVLPLTFNRQQILPECLNILIKLSSEEYGLKDTREQISSSQPSLNSRSLRGGDSLRRRANSGWGAAPWALTYHVWEALGSIPSTAPSPIQFSCSRN